MHTSHQQPLGSRANPSVASLSCFYHQSNQPLLDVLEEVSLHSIVCSTPRPESVTRSLSLSITGTVFQVLQVASLRLPLLGQGLDGNIPAQPSPSTYAIP